MLYIGLLVEENVSKDDNNNAVLAEVVSPKNFRRLIGITGPITNLRFYFHAKTRGKIRSQALLPLFFLCFFACPTLSFRRA